MTNSNYLNSCFGEPKIRLDDRGLVVQPPKSPIHIKWENSVWRGNNASTGQVSVIGDNKPIGFEISGHLPRNGTQAAALILSAAEKALGRRVRVSHWTCTKTRKTFNIWGG